MAITPLEVALRAANLKRLAATRDVFNLAKRSIALIVGESAQSTRRRLDVELLMALPAPALASLVLKLEAAVAMIAGQCADAHRRADLSS